MTLPIISPKEHILTAFNCQEVKIPPCSFMLFNGLREQCQSYEDFIYKQIELGLQPYIQLPMRPPVVQNDYYNLHGLPVSYDQSVEVNEWKETSRSSQWPILVKEYFTPAGILRSEVYQTDDWRWGDHVPFLDDYLESRSKKFIVESEQDLEALSYLLTSPKPEEIQDFQKQAETYRLFAHKLQLPIIGGWGVGADLLGWVFGLENMIYSSHDAPDFMHNFLNQIAHWNQDRMKIVLEAGVDLYLKRAWYENCDFWSPRSYQKFILPILADDVKLAHQYGTKLGYFITSSAMPLVEMIIDAGVDVLVGIDPLRWDFEQLKKKSRKKICLWGGVNGHLTVEQGRPIQVRQEVQRAIQQLAPGGGFILSPVDNVRFFNPQIEINVRALVNEWTKSSIS